MTASGVSSLRIGAILFFFVLSLYLLTYGGSFRSIDEISLFSAVESVSKTGSPTVNQLLWTTSTVVQGAGRFGSDGRYFTDYEPLHFVLAIPLYLLSLNSASLGTVSTVLLFNCIVTALTCAILFAWARRISASAIAAVLTSLAYGFGTMAWQYTKGFFREPLAALMLTAAGFFLTKARVDNPRWAVVSGACMGLAVATRTATAPLAAVFLVLLIAQPVQPRHARGRMARSKFPIGLIATGLFTIGFSIVIVALQAYQWAIWGSSFYIRPTVLGSLMGVLPQEGGMVIAVFLAAALAGIVVLVLCSRPFWRTQRITVFGRGQAAFAIVALLVLVAAVALAFPEAVYGLSFGSGRGLFIYSPVLLASFAGAGLLIRRHPAEGWLVLLVAVCAFVLNALTHNWWAGLSWGPRYLLPAVPILTLSLLPLIEKSVASPRAKGIAAGLGILLAASVLIQLLAVTVDYTAYAREIQERFGDELSQQERLLDWRFSPLLGQLAHLQLGDLDFTWILKGQESTAPVDVPVVGVLLGQSLLFISVLVLVLARPRTLTSMPAATALSVIGVISLCSTSYLALSRMESRLQRTYASILEPLVKVQSHSQEGDILVSLLPFSTPILLNANKRLPPLYGLHLHNPPVPSRLSDLLRQEMEGKRRIWLLAETNIADPSSGYEEFLSRYAFKADDTWLSGFRLAVYGLSDAESLVTVFPNVSFSGKVVLARASYAAMVTGRLGEIIPVSLVWRCAAPVHENYTVFVHLVDRDGRGWIGHDGEPADRFRPTATWGKDEEVLDNHGLLITDPLPPGEYEIKVGLYQLTTRQRLAVLRDAKTLSDAWTIGRVVVARD